VVTIGFDAAGYMVTETASTISRPVSVSVQSGSLARDVVVTIRTMDGSARGGTVCHTHCMCHACLSFFPPAPSDYRSVTINLTFNADNTN